jgi:phasin family protein
MTVMDSLKEKASSFMASAAELNSFAIDKLEEMMKMNVASASYYGELGIRQMRAMSELRDLESMHKFTGDSISLSGEIVKKMLDDSKAWMNLGTEVKEKVTGIFSKGDEVEIKKKPAKPAVS